MSANLRKRLVYVALGAFLLYFGGDYVVHNYVDVPLEQRQARKEQLQKKIKAKKKELAEAKDALGRLDEFEARSLPSDLEVARTVYRSWLLSLVDESKFHSAHVDSSPPASRKGYYDTLAFSVRANGSLLHLCRFLYDFYHAGHLHKIQSISLTPLGKTGEIDIALSIEALALPGTERTDELSNEVSNRLEHASVKDYQLIAQRNVFSAGGESDLTKQAFLTAVTRTGNEPEIWFTLRGKGSLLKLHEGNDFEIGSVSGRVVEILDDDVILESVGERWLLSIGEPLAAAVALPPEY